MKTPIYTDRTIIAKRKARRAKTMSHGSYRAKRKPNSPRVKKNV